MKRFKDPTVLFLWILSLVMVIFLLQPYARGETAMETPGPDFHDKTWEQSSAQENWNSMYLTLVGYIKRDSKGTEMGMEVYYNSELVMQAWGVMFRDRVFDFKNSHYSIKQEDGNWKIGNVGQEWWEVIDEKEKIWFFVTTESGLKEGRGFPKGDFGESPEELPEMEID